MGLDISLIGVIGASAALFIIFCIIAIIVGCFCLRRAKRRRQQQLLEQNLQERREGSKQNSQYMDDTLNKAPSIVARSNGGDSVARSDGYLHKMTDYRPKILEDSMISNGYRSNSRAAIEEESSQRGGNTISTIFVNENKTAEDSDNNNLDYNHSNGYIVKGYLHNSIGPNGIENPHYGIPQTYMTYGHPVAYIEDMSYVRQERERPRSRQVFKQSVEMGKDGRLVVTRSQQEHVKPDPETSAGSKMMTDKKDQKEEEKGSLNHPTSSSSSSGQARGGMNQEATGQSSRPVSESTREEHPAIPSPKPMLSDQEEWRDVITSGVVPATSPKTTNPENYKVIKREHSSHSRMPEWVVGAVMVDEEISRRESTDNNDVFLAADTQAMPARTIETEQQYQRQYNNGSTGGAIATDNIYHRVAYFSGGAVVDESQRVGFAGPPASSFHPPTFQAGTGGEVARAEDGGFAQMDFDAEDDENAGATGVQVNGLPGTSPTAANEEVQEQRVTFGSVSQYSLNSSDPPGFVSSRHGQIVDNPHEGAVDIGTRNSSSPERIAHDFAFAAIVEP